MYTKTFNTFLKDGCSSVWVQFDVYPLEEQPLNKFFLDTAAENTIYSHIYKVILYFMSRISLWWIGSSLEIIKNEIKQRLIKQKLSF